MKPWGRLVAACVHNNLTLVATLRIGWFIKPFRHQSICQQGQPLGLLLEVCYWFPTNIRCCCRYCGVSPPFHGTRSMVAIFKLCLSLLHSLITVACSCLRECRSNLILPLSLVCARNNPTLVATLRIGCFVKPFTHQTIFQWRQCCGRLVDVFSLSPTNICCWCLDCGV
jgi:hypothetical protein